MSYEVLTEEIKALPESYISQISDFIVYLRLKEKFGDFKNHKDLYKEALSNCDMILKNCSMKMSLHF